MTAEDGKQADAQHCLANWRNSLTSWLNSNTSSCLDSIPMQHSRPSPSPLASAVVRGEFYRPETVLDEDIFRGFTNAGYESDEGDGEPEENFGERPVFKVQCQKRMKYATLSRCQSQAATVGNCLRRSLSLTRGRADQLRRRFSYQKKPSTRYKKETLRENVIVYSSVLKHYDLAFEPDLVSPECNDENKA